MVAKHIFPLKPNSNLHHLKNIKHNLFLQCTLQIITNVNGPVFKETEWSQSSEVENT